MNSGSKYGHAPFDIRFKNKNEVSTSAHPESLINLLQRIQLYYTNQKRSFYTSPGPSKLLDKLIGKGTVESSIAETLKSMAWKDNGSE